MKKQLLMISCLIVFSPLKAYVVGSTSDLLINIQLGRPKQVALSIATGANINAQSGTTKNTALMQAITQFVEDHNKRKKALRNRYIASAVGLTGGSIGLLKSIGKVKKRIRRYKMEEQEAAAESRRFSEMRERSSRDSESSSSSPFTSSSDTQYQPTPPMGRMRSSNTSSAPTMQYAYANASRQDSSPVDSSPEVKAKRSYALLYLTSIPTMGSVVLMIASAGNAFHAWWKNRKNTTDKERLAIINVIAKNNPDLSLTNNKGVNAIQLTQDYLLSSYEDAYLAQALAEILELISPSAVREAELVSYATQESAPVQTTEVAEAIIVSAPEAD